MPPLSALLIALLLVPPTPVLPAPPTEPVGATIRGAAARDGPVGADSDRAVRPVPGPVRNAFDPPEQAWSSGHRGVDLAAAPGEAVRSALAGRVTFAGPIAGRGVVVVDHGGRRTTYEPVLAWVEVGEPVAAGEVVGIVEPVPGHCFPVTCLHWGLRLGEEYRDPLTLLGPSRVRLLPLLD